MGRPRKPEGQVKSVHLHIKMTQAFRDHVSLVAETAKDADASALVERLIARESRRLKLPPPPPR